MRYVTFLDIENLLDKIQKEDVLHADLSKSELKNYFSDVCKMLHRVWKEETSSIVGRNVHVEITELKKEIEKLKKENKDLKNTIRTLHTYSSIRKEYRQSEDKYLDKIEESYRDFYDSDKY